MRISAKRKQALRDAFNFHGMYREALERDPTKGDDTRLSWADFMAMRDNKLAEAGLANLLTS